ncbi:hypothetical protein LZ554_000564 [Drepanopeziza brunnea f. sp. 'monogermtubi']|nr:hypothetical protein LZ554_000564 [Drepanopeziza brunnea f. sp. 'monogermtubi']
MARLNEPAAAPTETIESLKRKFMRQNRDIARANSTQSLRIRSLENEISRLLADNLGLRAEIIRLHGEIENGKAQLIMDHTGHVKSQLEAKILEIGALLSGLGEPSPKKQSRQSERPTRASPATSPGHENWKNICTPSEAVAGQEGRLPPILENKSFPRRTLEQEEILSLVTDAEAASNIESPEIGPAPVSQFVDEDPVKIDLPRRTKNQDVVDTINLDPTTSVNLEQRRKRRDSSGLLDQERAGKPESSTTGLCETTGALKKGAKRKLGVRDDEETDASSRSCASSPDEFSYTRVANEDTSKTKSVSPPERPSNKPTKELAIARGAPRDKTTAIIANRKVLAPKCINQSPRKNIPASDNTKVNKQENQKPNNSTDASKDKKREPVRIQPSPDPMINTVEVQPDTPAAPAADKFSSELSEAPSTGRARDTPPPVTIGPTRPSRRARGAVSYAEPSLRDKMRRPTREMVDAVTRDEKEKARTKVKLEEHPGVASPTIKAEPEADDAWKNMPVASSTIVESSPLRNITPRPDLLPNSITTHRKRRESILNQTELDIPKTASGGAIAALLAETRRVKAAAKEKERGKAVEDETAVSNGMAALNIYEFRGSSPSSAEAPSRAIEGKAPTRFSRRYPRDHPQQPHQSDHEISDMEASGKPDRPAPHRRQSTLGLRSSSSNVEIGKEHEMDKAFKRSSNTTGATDVGAGGSRGDRISVRRRSMML